jgi:8-oxo-dGTP diphosphatase
MNSDQPAVRVLAAVIQREGKYLVCRRPLQKRHGGLWEFPGGKIEEGESDEDALKRELQEELDIEVTGVGKTLFSRNDPDSPFLIEFIETEIFGNPTPIEHSEAIWIDPSELTHLELAPSDAVFASSIRLQDPAQHRVE